MNHLFTVPQPFPVVQTVVKDRPVPVPQQVPVAQPVAVPEPGKGNDQNLY